MVRRGGRPDRRPGAPEYLQNLAYLVKPLVMAGLSLACNSWLIRAETVSPEPDPLAVVLAAQAGLAEVAERPEHEVQIRYTRITRDAEGTPGFEVFEHGVDSGKYFYPASSVKLPAALVAVEKLRSAGVDGLALDTAMLTGAAHDWQAGVDSDPSSASGLPSIGHYLRKIFLVSDNDAYNRLYEFVGADLLNRALAAKGHEGVRIFHRLAVRREPWHGRHCNPVRFVDGDRVLYELPARESKGDYSAPSPILKGRGHLSGGKRTDLPKDFAELNAFPLRAQQEVLRALLFPESVPEESRFAITANDRRAILRAMGERPRESKFPPYDAATVPDAYTKFLLFGGGRDEIAPHLRSFGKSGMAYGYLCDNAYLVDFDNGVEFLLAAVVHVNANGIYNDDHYEYESVGLPFLRDLGRAIYELELKREREHAPDLAPLEHLFTE